MMRFMGAAFAGVLTLAAVPAGAQTPEQFYQGKTLTIMLGHPPGGSYDLYARIAANHLKKHIPGNPNILVEHRPGGGGVRAAIFFYSQSPRDGSVISLFPESLAHSQIMQPEIGKWNLAEMSYIGSMSSVNPALVRWRTAPAKTVDEMTKISSTVGCSGKTSQSYQAVSYTHLRAHETDS